MEGSKLKAIETCYKGYRFRSRLEARWAVFFDALGLEWQYEAEGYDLDGDWYLPDFYFPKQKWFIEIKAGEATDHESALMSCLIDNINESYDGCRVDREWHRGFLFEGGIWVPGTRDPRFPFFDAPASLLNGGEDIGYHFCICACGRIGIEFEGRAERVCREGDGHGSHKDYKADHPRLIQAFTAALSARFEHGENGAPRKRRRRRR